MTKTPATPHKTEIQVPRDGISPSMGHDRSATQSGNMFVMVKTSGAGRRDKAKNVPTRLTLPEILRIHKTPGRQKTSDTPADKAQKMTNKKGMTERVMAMSGQGKYLATLLAMVAMQAKKRQPRSIHKYGRGESSDTMGVLPVANSIIVGRRPPRECFANRR